MAIKEGFLCPVCFQDQQSFHNLQSHFDESHSNEDKAVVSQIKDLFSKAKGKLLGKEHEASARQPSLSISGSSTYPQGIADPVIWEPQELGVTRRLMDRFKSRRDARIDRVVIETNKTVIRLEKILNRIKLTRKQNEKPYEQSLVPWVPDEDVPYCPTCGDKFIVNRRRHHCRLCGAIMCGKCSVFLPFQIADDLIQTLQKIQGTSSKISPVKKQQPVEDDDTDKISIRICIECDKVLLRHKDKLDFKNNPSLLVLLYNKMYTAMEAAMKQAPEYDRMSESLNNGEEEFKLDIATEKRLQLMQMFEAIDVLSKKIAVLNTHDEENPPKPGILRLQTAIRKSACAFLQENMLVLGSLPSQPKLAVLQARRKAENERRLRMQREEALRRREEEKRQQEIERLKKEREAEKHKHEAMQCSIEYKDVESALERQSLFLLKEPGWSADTVSIASNSSRHSKRRSYSSDEEQYVGFGNAATEIKIDETLGALLEQIDYVKQSIKQAHAAGLAAEATSLEKNLEELFAEYKKQSTAKAFAVTPSNSEDFLEEEKGGAFGFSPSLSRSDDTGEDPLLQQIRYISKSAKEAELNNKLDEARMLNENLHELKAIYESRMKLNHNYP